MKKRYLAIPAVILLILMSCSPLLNAAPWLSFLFPVRPFIQLPGEVYPGTVGMSILGGWTNTFSAMVLTWVIVLFIIFSLRARSRTADEVPTGFYNFFEMVLEGAYRFAENIAGPKKVKDFFPFFMTYILIILVANWLGLVPGFDSIGLWESKPHFEAEKEIHAIEAQIEAFEAAHDEAGLNAFLANLEETYHLDHAIELENGHITEHSEEELFHAIEHAIDEENIGDMRNGLFLTRAIPDADGNKPEGADWTIVPFFRPAATDMNMTLAFALVAIVMVQYYGFKYLGFRGYLGKFFPFINRGFGAEINKNPIKAIDPAVGFLELVSEISKIISFTFRLLGNIFAGMVLLFVMAALLPIANLAFFGLEFFVALIQALVFALLMLIFMSSATESHGHGEGEEHH